MKSYRRSRLSISRDDPSKSLLSSTIVSLNAWNTVRIATSIFILGSTTHRNVSVTAFTFHRTEFRLDNKRVQCDNNNNNFNHRFIGEGELSSVGVQLLASTSRTSRKTNLHATIAIEKGLSSSLNDDGDNEDDDELDDDFDTDEELDGYDADVITPSTNVGDGNTFTTTSTTAWKQQQRSKRKNRAMRDPQFVRKRTDDLIRASIETANSPNIIDPCIVLDMTNADDCETAATAVGNTINGNGNGNNINVIGRNMRVEKKTFHFLLDAWAFSGEDDAAEQAIRLLQCMESCHKSLQENRQGESLPILQLEPDVRSYTKTMNAIARRADLNAGLQADVLYQRMKANGCQPNSYTYTALIQAHANSGAANRANEQLQVLVKRFELEYQQLLQVGVTTIPDSLPQPTAKAFHAVMHAYSKAGQAEQAELVLNQMEQLYQKYGNRGLPGSRPNHFHYNTLISAYANGVEDGDNGFGAERAEQILDRMTRYVQPTTVSYNAVIDALAKSGLAEKAESLLRSMLGEGISQHNQYSFHRPSPPKPNTRSFNSVMNAWAKSKHEDSALRAEVLLDLMEKRYEMGDALVRPDVHSFCTVINAWARSPIKDKAERAKNLYQEMEKLYKAGNKYVRPNVVAVNAVLNSCAYTVADDFRTSNRAVEIAHSILQHLEKNAPAYGRPDQITYGTFLKVCAVQMPNSSTREQVVEVLFKKCAKDGQVGNFVLHQLQLVASDDLYCYLVGRNINEPIRVQDLPNSWWCNADTEEKKKWRSK